MGHGMGQTSRGQQQQQQVALAASQKQSPAGTAVDPKPYTPNPETHLLRHVHEPAHLAPQHAIRRRTARLLLRRAVSGREGLGARLLQLPPLLLVLGGGGPDCGRV